MHDRRALRRVCLLVLAAAVVAAGVAIAAGDGAAGHPVRAAAGTAGHPVRTVPGAGRVGRPNIVFVLTDDLSMDLLRFMPQVQALQARGMTFSNYFVSDSLCCPSRASIFTGNFPHDTGVYTNDGPYGGIGAFHALGDERSTFNVALQRAGYRTAMMGKYLNGYLQGPTRSPVPSTYVPPGWNEWDVAGWGYPEFDYQMNIDGRVHQFGHRPRAYLTNVLARRGARFIGNAARAGTPFFLELATFSPHTPYVPAPRDAHKFPGLKAPKPPNFDRLPVQAPAWLANRPPLTSRQIARIDWAFKRRVQAVQSVDDMLTRIQQALQRHRLLGNTYIVFSSDNGLHTGEYRLMPGKLTAFDTDIHVPLVVAGPGISPGSTTDAMAENTDLADTFSAMGGTSMASDGHTLMPLLQGASPSNWRNAILVEHHGPAYEPDDPDAQTGLSGNPPSYEALRTTRFLYVEYIDGERELYDLQRDPYELYNVVGDLTPLQLYTLHADLLRLESCHDATACWAAGHAGPLPQGPNAITIGH
ncbi:MAG TPA: sulfatase [Solirubrobacteraceae bacterium]|nr:sulfatase [Solirubrobacteraceae bacterium]